MGSRRRRDDDGWSPREKPSNNHAMMLVLAVVGGAALLLAVLCAGFFFIAIPWAFPDVDAAPELAELPPQGQVPAGAPPAQMQPATVSRVKDATVYLRVQLPNGDVAEGSGFFCGEPGVVVTNAHVLGMLRAEASPPRTVEAVVHSGEANELKTTASVLAVDRSCDLAVLRAAGDPAGLPQPLSVQSAQDLIETQKVCIFGFPFGAGLGKNITVSESSVSSLRKSGLGPPERVQVNGGMNPGSSGGPVTDVRGSVVGVSVSIIRGTQINFAVPGDAVLRLLEGKFLGCEPGRLYQGDGRQMLPLKCPCLDPLGRIKSARVEVWAGEPAKEDAAGFAAMPQGPARVSADGPVQSFSLVAADGGYSADISLPHIRPGQVCWARTIALNASRATRVDWEGPITLDMQMVLVRKPAAVQFTAPAGTVHRSLHVSTTSTVNVYQARENATFLTHKLEGDVLESLYADARGLGTIARLTIGKCSDSLDTADQRESPPQQAYTLLSQFSPTFLVVANHSITERGKRNFAVLPRPYQVPVERMFNLICNVFESSTVPLPNRTVRPGESWPVRLPMFIVADKKAQIQDLHLSCLYEGTRSANGNNEAYISLGGVVKGRGPRALELGRVKGHALFDVDRGFLNQVKLAVNSELEDEDRGVRILVSKEIVVRRSEGNTLGITPATVNQPGAK
jgi:S1-C subfamily serine protease